MSWKALCSRAHTFICLPNIPHNETGMQYWYFCFERVDLHLKRHLGIIGSFQWDGHQVVVAYMNTQTVRFQHFGFQTGGCRSSCWNLILVYISLRVVWIGVFCVLYLWKIMNSTIRVSENFKLLMQYAHVFTRRVVQTIEHIRELISCTNTSLKAAWRHCVYLSLRVVRTGGRTESHIQNNIHCKNYTLLKSDVEISASTAQIIDLMVQTLMNMQESYCIGAKLEQILINSILFLVGINRAICGFCPIWIFFLSQPWP